jgi:hypothetical protein
VSAPPADKRARRTADGRERGTRVLTAGGVARERAAPRRASERRTSLAEAGEKAHASSAELPAATTMCKPVATAAFTACRGAGRTLPRAVSASTDRLRRGVSGFRVWLGGFKV